MRRNSFFTIIVVPDAQANYKKFSISRKKIYILCYCIAIFFLSFIILCCSNVYFANTVAQLKKVVPENKKLKDENSSYKKAIVDLTKKMEDFGFVAKKLKLMAGITHPT